MPREQKVPVAKKERTMSDESRSEPRRITLFGASGAIGRLLLAKLLESGFQVTAYVRSKRSLPVVHERLAVVEGALTEAGKIDQAIAGASVVVSTLGPALDMSRRLKGTPVADGHARILQCMEARGIRRFLTIGTPTLRHPGDARTFGYRLVPLLARVLFPNGHAEMKAIERLLLASPLDWTVVRFVDPKAKTDGDGIAHTLGDGAFGFQVSRANIASFLLESIDRTDFVRAMPIVFNR